MLGRRLFSRLGLIGGLALLVPLALPGAPSAAEPNAGSGAVTAAQAGVSLDRLSVSTTQVAFGLQRPTGIIAPDDGSGRLLITEKGGRIRTYHPDTGLAAEPLPDISDRVDISGNERGLLGIATTSDFAETHTLYVVYTSLPDGEVTLSRFPLTSAAQTPIPASGEEIVLTQPHAEYRNHNGGHIAFGPDGYLYWGIGDGGGSDDVLNSGQNLGTLLGKILRLDVDRSCAEQTYCVPADNPFVGVAGARAEIWAFGLRNPWKFSLNQADGSLWIADVGQGTYEEINHLRDGGGGANLGWSCREGPQVFNIARCAAGADYIEPVYHYQTSVDGCAVVGGYVYRGQEFADIATGTYLATDYCSGTGFAVRPDADGSGYETRALEELTIQPTSLGEDENGELYLVNDLPGQLHKISFEATPPPAACSVSYVVDSQWGTGFTTTVRLTNTGSQAVNGWTVGWSFSGTQRVGQWWNAVGSQQGAVVTARNAAWNGTIAPGATVNFGFLGTSSGANPAPTSFTLNGAACG